MIPFSYSSYQCPFLPSLFIPSLYYFLFNIFRRFFQTLDKGKTTTRGCPLSVPSILYLSILSILYSVFIIYSAYSLCLFFLCSLYSFEFSIPFLPPRAFLFYISCLISSVASSIFQTTELNGTVTIRPLSMFSFYFGVFVPSFPPHSFLFRFPLEYLPFLLPDFTQGSLEYPALPSFHSLVLLSPFHSFLLSLSLNFIFIL